MEMIADNGRRYRLIELVNYTVNAEFLQEHWNAVDVVTGEKVEYVARTRI